MVVATARRSRKLVGATEVAATPPEIGEDGHPVRRWMVRNPGTGVEEVQVFSLRPFSAEERKVYWNPIYIGQQMWWRSQELNEFGVQPVMQKEVWIDGKFSPRNAWEEQMTMEFIKSLPGGDPERWVGFNHPDNEPGKPCHHWRCECGWPCGNWQAFQAHRRYLRHQESMSE